MSVFIKHIQGSKVDQLESFETDTIRIGRQSDNDLRFDPQQDPSVSGYQAEIYRDGEKYFLKDLQSRNGTFVNGRRIDAPMALKDGDNIQFSTRGPKIVFSTKDPSAPEPTAVGGSGESAPTQVFAAEEKQPPEKQTGIWERTKSLLPIFAAAVAFLAILGVSFYLGMPWWGVMITAAIMLLVAAGGYFGWRMWKRRRSVAEQKKSAQEEREASLGHGDQNNLQDLKRKWTEVLQSLKNSKLQKSGEDSIYALPWFLVIGESGCGKSALIKSGGSLSSVVTPGSDGPTRNCDWWFFPKAVVLDASGRYAFQSKESEAQGEWRTLLSQLRTNRRSEPLNGVVVMLAADALASRPVDKLKEQAAQLRERLDEVTQLLGIKIPVYLVVSKCDVVPGFNEVFNGLPERARSQALGHANSDPVDNSDASRFFDRAFRVIVDRLERLRLAVLGEAERTELAHDVFLFPAELKSLQAPLKASVDILFRPSPYRDAPFFRGIFFTSARRTGAFVSRLSRVLGSSYYQTPAAPVNHDLFVRDFFSTIFPNDRSLVGHTALSHERVKITRAVGLITAIAASLVLCGLFTLSFKNNWTALGALKLEASRCSGGEKNARPILQSLGASDDCRRVIDDYLPKSFWQKMGMNFGLAQWRRVGTRLRERFLVTFSATVLEPLNSAIEKKLDSGSGSPMLLGAIFQRMQLLSTCQESPQCAFAANGKDANYVVMLSAIDSQTKDNHPSVDVFERNYRSYLLWQTDKNVYERMKNKDLERIERWVNSGGLNNESVVISANEIFSPIRASDFWEVSSTTKVDGAYTLNAWSKGIEPLLSALKQIGKQNYENDAKEFERKYKRDTVQKWGEFLTRFVDVQPRNAATPRILALTLIGSKSPYQAVLQSANENLSGIFRDTVRTEDSEPWLILTKNYVELKAQLDQRQKDSKEKNERDKEAVGYLAVYFEALKQLPAKLSTPQDSFIAAQSAFREGEAPGKPTQPILQAYWALKMLKSTERFRYQDPIFWQFLEYPIHIAWKSLLEEAGAHLQQQWRQIYLAGSGDDVAPGAKAAKVIEFVNNQGVGFLKPLRNGFQVNTIQGQGVPFTAQFIGLISTLGPDSLSGNSRLPDRIVRN